MTKNQEIDAKETINKRLHHKEYRIIHSWIIHHMVSLFLKAYAKMQGGLNNRKMKSKIIYVYILCVLVPVLITNTIIIGNIVNISKDEQKENINNIADSLADDIYSALESAVYTTVDLYTSKSICNFLDEQYKEEEDYYQEYSTIFNNYVFYATSKHLISDISFYSDNSTMINGGRYYRIDAIEDKDWYQKFRKTDKDLIIDTYYNNTFYISHRKRMISVIRKLNYTGVKSIEKIVKLDLNYNQIQETINSSAFETVVYLCHDDKIIFSNDILDKGENEDFLTVDIIREKDIQMQKEVTAYGYDWDIYITGYKSDYSTLLKDNLWLLVILFLADALLPAVMLTLFSDSITKRILLLGKYLKNAKGKTFELISVNVGKDEIGELLDNYNLMTSRMKDLIEYEYKSKLEQQELYLARQQAELLALYSQINPHFLFNVLESIRMHSVIKGEEETSAMIESLARLMRKSAQWGADYITLSQEVEFTADYLRLQKYRYGEGFHYKIKIQEECYAYKIPSLVLVTFVENACVHGLNREGHYGTIFVSAYEEKGYFYIEIEDTGVGIKEEEAFKLEERLGRASIDELQKTDTLGMLNAAIRLKKYWGKEATIKIESEPYVGTCVIIRVPAENIERELITGEESKG